MSTEEVFQKVTDKQRIVIAGSEGTELTAEIMRHVLSFYNRRFDYFEKGQYHGQPGSSIAIIVADESIGRYNPIPDFRKFHHHIGVICSINHTVKNGFPSEDDYIRQYDLFADATPKGGILAYCEQDPIAAVLCNKERADVAYLPFKVHQHVTENSKIFLLNSHKEKISAEIPSRYSLQFLDGAKQVLKRIGISSDQFYAAIVSLPR
jgi:UDP-N-acetylmuramate: L-alanyl-gamma-D-glutamyl-meso-diaminopimelate ligase